MNKKYVMFDLADERILSLSNVLSNKTCKKILEYLADKESSETEIAHNLSLPANTVNYNIKQLLNSGFIEKAKDFFWSVKGRKILRYRVAKKSIVISPKSSNFKTTLAAVLVTAIGALIIKIYSDSVIVVKNAAQSGSDLAISGNGEVMSAGALSAVSRAADVITSPVASQFSSAWEWFLLGGLFALLVYFLISELKWFRILSN